MEHIFNNILNDSIFTIFIGFVAFLLAFVFLKQRRIGKKLPPGPYGLPIVGYLPFITRKPYIKFQQLKEKYGPIYSLRIGSRNIIVLSDYNSIKTAFAQDAFMGRPPDSAFELSKETVETGAINTIRWKEQRKFMIQSLKDLGFTKDTIETHIREEISELLEILEKQTNRPITLSKFLIPSMSNNISSLVFGKRRGFEDPKRIMLNGILREVGQNAGQVAWQSFFPWLKALFRSLGLFKGMSSALKKMRKYVREEVKEHKSSLDENNPRDFMDHYLVEIQKRKGESNTTFLEPVMVDLVGGIFGAGSGTVRVSVEWLILVSATFRNVQKAVQEEIDEIIGRDRFPTKSDIKQMPYTDAVMSETLRWRCVVPINILRYTLADTTLGPFFIPKDSYVVGNLWAVLHEQELWGNDAEEFRPERFLSRDKKTVHKPDYFIPFSTGKRQCPGEPMALFETFLYYTAILQKFDISLPENAVPDFDGQLGISLDPKPYKVLLKLRN